MIQTQLPAGCRMPAEWEPHAATWIAWPHERDDWPGKFDAIVWVYAEIVRHLHRSEPVRILVNSDSAREEATAVLEFISPDWERIEFFEILTDRVWTRDYCPLFVKAPDGSVIATDWLFTGWAKYPNHRYDDAVTEQLCERLGLPRYQPMLDGRRIVLEGGAIDVNGQGLLLTTEECLLSPIQARNPGLGRDDLEQVLRQTLGVEKILWLGNGIAGDDTHGHVDDLARFVDANTVVLAVEDNSEDPNFAPLQDNLRRLRGQTDRSGRVLEVVPLPMPEPLTAQGVRLPASYANFYIANEVVLVPTFNDPADRQALGILADLFPRRKVVGIHAVDLVWGLGTLHCLTQQQPLSG